MAPQFTPREHFTRMVGKGHDQRGEVMRLIAGSAEPEAYYEMWTPGGIGRPHGGHR